MEILWPAERRRTSAALAVAAAVATLFASPCGSEAVAVPSLDPDTYAEPDDAAYWSGRELRVKTADLSREGFDSRIMDGQVFVVEDLGQDWPMANWNCDYFRSDPVFSQAEMNKQYHEGSGSDFVGFKSGWVESKTSSGAKDTEAPQLAPFYWGIKDVQFADARRSKTWKRSMLKKVQEHVRLPRFMDGGNLRSFNDTPEFWFAGRGAGAKAHMDTHIQATMSIQLAGTKRWRLSMMGRRHAPFLTMIYKDGEVYERTEPWRPHLSFNLSQGEALFFPPGFVHETLNVEDAEDSCSASVTFQFSKPMAVRMYRRFLPRIRRTADIHEAWPNIQGWATIHGRTDKKGKSYAEAKAEALGESGVGATFRKYDKNGDGFLSKSELAPKLGEPEAQNLVGFHDLDDDGRVAREEFAEVFGLWAGTVKAVVEDTPKKLRKYQLKDMEGEFNIEDLPSKVTRPSLESSRNLEAGRLQALRAKGLSVRSEL